MNVNIKTCLKIISILPCLDVLSAHVFLLFFCFTGTMKAAVDLMEKIGANVMECLVVIELNDLNGRAKVTKPFHSLIQY